MADDYPQDITTTGVVVIGGETSGSLEITEDEDWFRVSLTAGSRYIFTLKDLRSGEGALGTYHTAQLVLRDSVGVFLDSTISEQGPEGDLVLSFIPENSGEFFLAVRDYSGDFGTYTLAAELSLVPDDFSSNTSTTGMVPLGGTATGNLELVNDVDWFRVSLTAGTKYVFEMLGVDGGGGTLGAAGDALLLELYENDSNWLANAITGGTNGDPLLTFTPSVTGDYFLAAREYDDKGTGTYTLKAYVAPPDDFTQDILTTGVVPIGGQATGDIEIASDRDWFKVSLIAGDSYVFQLEGFDQGGGTLGQGDAQTELFIYDSNGEFLDRSDRWNASGNPASTMAYFPTYSGDFFLGVREKTDSSTGTYTLKASEFVDDFGNNINTLGTLAVAGQVLGDIEFPNDVDWFRISLQGGQQYVFELLGGDGGGGTLGLGEDATARMDVFDIDSNFLGASLTGGTGGDPLMAFTPSTSGDYFLQVSGHLDIGSGTYTLRANEAVTPDDYAGDVSTLGSLAAEGMVTGNIELSGDEDWFRIDLEQGKSYQFQVLGDAGGGGTLLNTRMVLYDATGVGLVGSAGGGPGGDAQLDFAPASDGEFFLGVDVSSGGLTGTYTLNASVVNQLPAGGVTLDGSPVNGETLTVNTSNLSDADGLGVFSYQWLRGGLAILGATSDTYLLVQADVANTISIRVTYLDGGGIQEVVVSAPTGPIGNVGNNPPDGNVVIAGEATVGETLSADTSGLSDIDGLGDFDYQWLRDGLAIGGATMSTYVPTFGDVGEEISVIVEYTDGGDSLERLTSSSTTAVESGLSLGDIPLIDNGLSEIIEVAVQQVFVGLLGRPVKESGEIYWKTEVEADNGFGLTELMSNIVNEQPEYINAFSELDREGAVTLHFNYLFSRDPFFDNEGNNYWIDGPGSAIPTDQLVLALLLGTIGDDQVTLSHKMFVAGYISDTQADLAAPAGVPVLGAVTASLSTVLDALKAVDLYM